MLSGEHINPTHRGTCGAWAIAGIVLALGLANCIRLKELAHCAMENDGLTDFLKGIAVMGRGFDFGYIYARETNDG